MKSETILPKVLLSLRIILGLVFLLSGITKLFSPYIAAIFLVDTFSFSIGIALVAIYFVSIVEVALGVLFLIGRAMRIATPVACSAFAVFVLLGAILSSNPIQCGCFGGFLNSSTNETFLVRNILLLFMSLIIMRELSKSQELAYSKE